MLDTSWMATGGYNALFTDKAGNAVFKPSVRTQLSLCWVYELDDELFGECGFVQLKGFKVERVFFGKLNGIHDP